MAGPLSAGITPGPTDTITNIDLENLVNNATINDDSVALQKLVTQATATFIGRKTAGPGSPEVLTVSDVQTLLAIGSTTTIKITETQIAHGFTAGQVVRYTGTAWVLAQSDTVAHSRARGVIESTPTADTFVLVTNGLITLSALTSGNAYFLDPTTAGAVTTTAPTIALLTYFAISTTQAFVTMSLDPQALQPQRTTVADANYTILTSDRLIAITSLSAARTFTLPAANAVAAGTAITVVDESGSVSTTNTISIARVGSDTVNGQVSMGLSVAYNSVTLRSDGVSKWVVHISPGFSNTVLITTTGNWTVPLNITRCKATVIGGGGGAGGSNNSVQGGGGGGAAGIAIGYLTGLTPGSTILATIGAAGTAGTSGGAGGSGGTTTFSSLTASGGTGGVAASGTSTTGGAGGTASGGSLFNLTGQTGGLASSFSGTASGSGASCQPYGAGGAEVFGASGRSATGFGAAGSGGQGTTATGGAGAPGIVIIEY